VSAFIEGLLAGYGIAMPVGAIGVLLIDLALRRGFRPAVAAALGAATADLTYALIAVLLGAAVAEWLEPYQDTLRMVSGIVLLLIAANLARGALKRRMGQPEVEERVDSAGVASIYLRFLGLTILNPATITYFVALIVGLDKGSADLTAKTLFVVAVFLASASWQVFLAGVGAVLHKRLPEGTRLAVGLVGVAVVAGLALKLLLTG
jgi:threonine/homoserine/homoserine lactone efflux protein